MSVHEKVQSSKRKMDPDETKRLEKIEDLIIATLEMNGYEPVESMNVMSQMIVKSFVGFGTKEHLIQLTQVMLDLFDHFKRIKGQDVS